MVLGRSNGQMGQRLNCTTRQAARYVETVTKKVGAPNRAAAVARLVGWGYIDWEGHILVNPLEKG
jgi:DNA-binding CsgD family transcriptional regulator